MLPSVLLPLQAPVETLQAVGPALVKTLKRLQIRRILDLIFHLPTGIAYFPLKKSLLECFQGEPVALLAKVVSYEESSHYKRTPAKVICDMEGIPLTVIFFKTHLKSLEKRLPIGQTRLLCGTIDKFLGTWQMAHPERTAFPEAAPYWKDKMPFYPLTAGLFQSQAQKVIQMALKLLPDLPEWLPNEYSSKWPSWKGALQKVHAPEHQEDLEISSPSRQRLAFDELFADQLALGLTRKAHLPGKSIAIQQNLKERVLQAFGHPLTPGQAHALAEIEADLASSHRMVRLLQGDVGSGKTLVAFLAISHAIEAGFQAALLVPTEILATQHMENLSPLAKSVGIDIALVKGRQKKSATFYEDLNTGKIQLVIGTHALLQDPIQFKNLGLAIIDEQHRFGVEQRLQLAAKGDAVDVLVMTATPIPRTLCLTSYGDIEVSRIPDKPKGRKPIQTRTIDLSRLEDVYQGVDRFLSQGQKVYWVCPLVEESEVLDLAAAKERYETLCTRLGKDKVGLVYGKQKTDEKESMMAAFKEGNCKILVATTVIEVGIDIKDANLIIIEHAERFGLAQLHQLRGRVGRNDQDAHCLLLYTHPLSPIAKQRLSIMRESEDGFRIAEEDLILRGGGDILGTKQSGLPSYKLADPLTCGPLLEEAHKAANDLLQEDPHLVSPRGQAARLLLSLFGQEKAIYTLGSG
jgi:ATP-dependent DNA helicase RecG